MLYKSCIVNGQFWVKKLLHVVLGDLLCTDHVIMCMRSKLCSLHNGKTLLAVCLSLAQR